MRFCAIFHPISKPVGLANGAAHLSWPHLPSSSEHAQLRRGVGRFSAPQGPMCRMCWPHHSPPAEVVCRQWGFMDKSTLGESAFLSHELTSLKDPCCFPLPRLTQCASSRPRELTQGVLKCPSPGPAFVFRRQPHNGNKSWNVHSRSQRGLCCAPSPVGVQTGRQLDSKNGAFGWRS